MSKISAYSLLATIKANIDNERLDDEAFRAFVKNSLPVAYDCEEQDPKFIKMEDKLGVLSKQLEQAKSALEQAKSALHVVRMGYGR